MWWSRQKTLMSRDLERLLVPLLGVLLVLRVLWDDRSATDSRHTGSINVSAAIAVLLIVVAAGLLLRHRRGVVTTTLAVLWLCVWTAIAVHTNGLSGETLREGVREVSVVALAVIVYNSYTVITMPVATRLVQLAGFIPAALAVYQVLSHTGLDVAGNVRSNGTFAHPNSAAMFFAIAMLASIWLYLDYGRRRTDALLAALFGAALIATFSIDGLISLVTMLVIFGALRIGFVGTKLVPWTIAALMALAFFATPLGSKRVAGETTTSLAAAERGETTSTLDTRLYRWKTLLPEWERSPIVGRGIGTTTTTENTTANHLNGLLPHNEYIRYLVETGFLGLVLLLVGLTLLVRSILRKRAYRVAVLGANAATLAIAVVSGCLINSLADNTLLNSPTCYAAALIVGAVLALPQGANADRFVGDA